MSLFSVHNYSLEVDDKSINHLLLTANRSIIGCVIICFNKYLLNKEFNRVTIVTNYKYNFLPFHCIFPYN